MTLLSQICLAIVGFSLVSASPQPVTTTSEATSTATGFRVIETPIHPIIISNRTIPLSGSLIAKWSYYEDLSCNSFLGELQAYESDLHVCYPLQGNSILFEYLLSDVQPHFTNYMLLVACSAKDCQQFPQESSYRYGDTAICIDVHNRPSYTFQWSL